MEPLVPVTSLIGPTLAVITGVVPVGMAFAAFANPMIFLFMGGFILAKAMMTHGIDKRFAYWLLSRSWVGSNPRRIFLAIGLAAALCSGWISNTATAVLVAPIALQSAIAINVSPYPFLLAVTVGASMCFASPFSTPPNALVMSAGKYTFMDYVKVGLPLQIVMGIVMVFILPLLFPF